jgi:hypothetical protein
VWEVIIHVRKRNVGKRKGRTQDIGFPLAIKEIWERQEGVRGSVLEQEGGFWERVIGKPTVCTPRNNVDSRIQCDTVGVRSQLPDSSSVVFCHKGNFDRKSGVFTGKQYYSFNTVSI